LRQHQERQPHVVRQILELLHRLADPLEGAHVAVVLHPRELDVVQHDGLDAPPLLRHVQPALEPVEAPDGRHVHAGLVDCRDGGLRRGQFVLAGAPLKFAQADPRLGRDVARQQLPRRHVQRDEGVRDVALAPELRDVESVDRLPHARPRPEDVQARAQAAEDAVQAAPRQRRANAERRVVQL